MGALPKNKITRAERGKRRAGNTPSLTRQVSHTTVPLHKRGFVSQLLQTLGLQAGTKQAQSRTQARKAEKKAAKVPQDSQNKAIQAKLAREVTKPAANKSMGKSAVRRSLNKDA